MAVGGDLAFPQVPGPRPTKVRRVNAYLARLQAAAASDASLATAFIRVIGMLDRPETLLRPDRIIRVLRAPHHPIYTPGSCSAPTPVPPSSNSWPTPPTRGAASCWPTPTPTGSPTNPSKRPNLLIKKVDRVGHGLRNINNYRPRLLPHSDIERPSNGTLPTPPCLGRQRRKGTACANGDRPDRGNRTGSQKPCENAGTSRTARAR
jgi:hypothetical protein